MSHDTVQRIVGIGQIVGGIFGLAYGGAYGAGGGSGNMIGQGIANVSGKDTNQWWHRKGGFGQDVLSSFGLGAMDKNYDPNTTQNQYGAIGQGVGGILGGLSGGGSGGGGFSGLFSGGGGAGAGAGAGAIDAGSGAFGSAGYGVLQSSGAGAGGASSGLLSGLGEGSYGTPGYGVMASSAGPSSGEALSNLGVNSGGVGIMQGLGDFMKSPLGKQLLGSMLGGGEDQSGSPQIPFLPQPSPQLQQQSPMNIPGPPANAPNPYAGESGGKQDLIGQQKLPQVAGQKSADDNLREALLLWQMTKGQPTAKTSY